LSSIVYRGQSGFAQPAPEMANIASPAPPPPPPPPAPPPPGDPRGAAPDPPTHDATPTPQSRLRRLQWVKIPAGRVAGAGRSVWSDVGDRFGSTSSGPPRLDFVEMEELFRVAEPAATTVNGVVRRPSDDVTSGDRTKHRDEVRHSTADFVHTLLVHKLSGQSSFQQNAKEPNFILSHSSMWVTEVKFRGYFVTASP